MTTKQNKKNFILLVNPWIHDFAAYDFWIKPLGILYLASFLKKNGYDIEMIDCLDPWNQQMRKNVSLKPPRRFPSGHGKFYKEKISKPPALQDIPRNYFRYGITPEVFCDRILQLPRPDLVVVTSMMTYWYPGVFEVIRHIRKIIPKVPIILGGNYVTLCPEHAALSGADFLVTGEGETKMANLLEKIFGKRPEFIPDDADLDSYPYPAFDLVSYPDHLPIRTSQGCPFECTYCASKILNSRFRKRNHEEVLKEILFWHNRFGINSFSLYDDAFLIDPEKMAIPFFKDIIKLGRSFQFHCPNALHLREVSDETAQFMFKAGFKTIRFGFETSDVLRQMETGGKATNDDLKRAVNNLLKAGYHGHEVGVYLLCGLPGQNAREVRESILFVKSVGARPILAEYSPIPGTKLWSAAIHSSPFHIAREPLFHNNTLLPCGGTSFTQDMYRSLKLITHNQ